MISRTEKMAADLSRAAPVERDVEQVMALLLKNLGLRNCLLLLLLLFRFVLTQCSFGCEWFVGESGRYRIVIHFLDFGYLILKE